MAPGMLKKRIAGVGSLLILVLLSVLLYPSQVLAAPSVSLDSAFGPAGTGITVQGSGWPVGDQIGVQWQDGRSIGGSVGAVSGTGNFAGYFYVPKDATPGTYTVVFQAIQNPSVTARVSFMVTIPTITLQPSSGPAGTAVRATGSGWPDGKDIEFSWDVNNFLGSAKADATGNVTFNFDVPTNAPVGNHTVLVNFTNGDTPVELSVSFTVTSGSIDLEVTNVQVLTQPVCAGSSPNFQADIRNNGTVESGFFGIRWNADGQLADGGHASIPAGGTGGHGHIWTNITQGNHSLTFIADYDNLITETNENNNQRTLNFVAIDCSSSTISGRVTDASNKPVSDVTISDGAGHITTTNISGTYTLSGLPAGAYTLTPTKSGYTFSPASRQVSVPPNKTGANFTGTASADTSKPGGVWIEPANSFVVTNDHLHFAAHAYDNQGGSGVAHVNFTAWWPGVDPNVWYIPCRVSNPTSGTTDVYECDWNLTDANGQPVPAGSLKVSFDVYDKANNSNLAPNGIRQGEVQRSTPPTTANISGNVYVDTNENGVKDPGESGYADAIVVLTGAATNSTATDPSGNYSFTGLQTGSFIITLTFPAGYHATTADPVNIQLTTNTTVNFGIVPNPSPTCTQSPPSPLPNDIVADFQQTRDDYCFANWSDHTLEEKIDAEWKAIINEYRPSELPSFLVQKTLLPITRRIYGADGLCYGMANSSLAYWQHSDLKPRQVTTYQLSKDESKDKIVEYHTLQIWETFNPTKIKAGSFLEDQKSEYQKLENYLKQGKPVLLNLLQGGNLFAEGHTVVAYRIHKNGSIMTIYVYDSNYPGVPQTATFDTRTNAFQYVLGPYRLTGFYVAEARLSVPDNARELIRSTFNAINNWFQSNNLFQIQLHSPVTGLVTNKQGLKIGYVGQSFVNEIPNAEMFKLGEETYFYLPTSGEYTLTTTGTSQATNTSVMGVDIIIPHDGAVKWIAYNNVPVRSSSTAQVKVSVSNTDYVMQMSNDAPRNPDTVTTIRPSSIYVPLGKK